MRYISKISVIILIVSSFIVILILTNKSKSTPNKNLEYLKDLQKLAVLVEYIDDEGKQFGLNEDEIKSYIELKLRQNSIYIIDANEITPMSAFLYININTIYLREMDHFIYSVEIELNQPVIIINNKIFTNAITWNKKYLAISPSKKIKTDIKEMIDSLLIFFLNDYLSVNQYNNK